MLAVHGNGFLTASDNRVVDSNCFAIMPHHLFDPDESLPPWPLKAYKNQAFINSSGARPIRVLSELMEPEDRFRRYGINSTLVFFGSARTVPGSRLQQMENELKVLQSSDGHEAEIKKLEQQLRIARKSSPYYDATRRLAAEVTRWSLSIPDPARRFHICSGGGPGIMEASNRGAREAGGHSVGLGISLPFEQTNNPYISDELNFEFHYFFIRKFWLFYLAKALVVFPGGFGTMDELFEVLTLIQTKKTVKYVPVILYGKEFWDKVLNFDVLVEWGMISPEDVHLFKIVDSVEEARDHLISELTRHYLEPTAEQD